MTTVPYSKCCEQSASHLDRVDRGILTCHTWWVKCELCGAAGPSIALFDIIFLVLVLSLGLALLREQQSLETNFDFLG